jgi:hypothetical protein
MGVVIYNREEGDSTNIEAPGAFTDEEIELPTKEVDMLE